MKKILWLMVTLLMTAGLLSAQNVGNDTTETSADVLVPAEKEAINNTNLMFVPLRSDSIILGVPPQSTTSQLTLGVIGTDVDNFFSATSFQDVSFATGFGFIGLDVNSLSLGVSRKFLGAITSLYYNGNIIEDMFAILANNSDGGNVSIQALEGIAGADYDLFGLLKGNKIDSRTNIGLLLGVGSVGIKLGYTQDLKGSVQEPSSEPVREGDNAYINQGKTAELNNGFAPSIEFGLRFIFPKVIFRTNLAATVDIHNKRAFNKGSRIYLGNYVTGNGTYRVEDDTVSKDLADYIEPAAALRLEFEFPTDERSRLSLGFELGSKMKFYSNTDDKGNEVTGIFHSMKIGTDGAGGYEYYTTDITDMSILTRPSVRYITLMTERLKLGLNAGIGLNFKFGKESSQYYIYDNFATFERDPSPMASSTENRITTLDLSISPVLGIGIDYAIVPNMFAVNAGVGAGQTLYEVAVRTVQKNIAGMETETPEFEQSWGKPVAQLALGANFKFNTNFVLDAMFSSNGIALENSNLVVQFSARF
jgi:hypothetical protein